MRDQLIPVAPTLETIMVELLDGLRKAITLTEVNVAAGIALEAMTER